MLATSSLDLSLTQSYTLPSRYATHFYYIHYSHLFHVKSTSTGKIPHMTTSDFLRFWHTCRSKFVQIMYKILVFFICFLPGLRTLYMEFCGIALHNWLVVAFISQFKSKFAKHFDKTVISFTKSTDYFSNEQYSTAR